jgi:hypothetical protein
MPFVRFKGTQRRRRRRLIRRRRRRRRKTEKKREKEKVLVLPMAARSLGRRRTATTLHNKIIFWKDVNYNF